MKVLLTHGYFIAEDEKEQEIMKPYPPLGILYLSAYLEKKGMAHEVYDTTFSTKEEFTTYLLKEKPDVVAFYTNLMTKVNVIELIQFIKKQSTLNKTTVIQGGPDITYNIENYLNYGGDIMVIGEGEETLFEVLTSIKNKQGFEAVNGIAFTTNNGEIVKTSPRVKIKDINALPIPNRKKINLHHYLDTWKEHHGKSAISVSTQRGCPYTCQWCSTAVYGQSYRRRSPEQVVEEVLQLQKEYKPDSIWFVDDVFTVSHKWLKAFTDEIKAKQVDIPFECITRADRMNEEVIQLLKEAGCFRVWIGAESGSQKIIDEMDRRVKVEEVQEMIVLSRNYGIEAGTFIMLGYPKETEEDIENTIHHLKMSNPDQFTITVAYPIKGTGLYEQVKELQTKDINWEVETDRDREFKRTYSRKYYDYAVTRVVNEVNFHKKRLENKHRNLAAIKMLVKSKVAKTGMNWHRLIG